MRNSFPRPPSSGALVSSYCRREKSSCASASWATWEGKLLFLAQTLAPVRRGFPLWPIRSGPALFIVLMM